MRDSLIKERERARGKILVGGTQAIQAKAGVLDQIVYLSVQMAAASDLFPQRRYPVLPARDGFIRRAPVLGKQQFAIRFENAPHFTESRAGIRY